MRPKKTDMAEVKNIANMFLHLMPQEGKIHGFILHPFISFTGAVDLDDSIEFISAGEYGEVFEKFAKQFYEIVIAKAKDFSDIMMSVTESYKMEFLRYCEPYLSEMDFAKALADWWVNMENPNSSYLVEDGTITEWFESIKDKGMLMDSGELDVYMSLPDTVTLYRGVGVGRKAEIGLSWTQNRKTAEWFAHRFDRNGKQGYLLKVEVPKERCIAYFNSRNEDEVLADCRNERIEKI